MSALSLRLPKSLHEQLRELAQEEGISVNQFVMLAVAEKVATISTARHGRGDLVLLDQQVVIRLGGVLAALIAVQEQARGHLFFLLGLLDRTSHQSKREG